MRNHAETLAVFASLLRMRSRDLLTVQQADKDRVEARPPAKPNGKRERERRMRQMARQAKATQAESN